MPKIETQIDPSSEKFKSNYEHHKALSDDLTSVLDKVREMGPPHRIEKHHKRGKLTARERIDKLKDENTDFLEFSEMAAFDVYDDTVPAAGIITGIATIHGHSCIVVANDATVKGGTYYPLTVKKHLRAQEIALENRLPCIYLVDSGGAFLPKQDEVFPDRDHFGRIFYNQARMSADGIPQIASVMGSCTAGGAYVPAMSDEAIIVNRTGTIFLGGPPLVKAAIGEIATPEELGGARLHTRFSGVADHFAENDDEAIEKIRGIVNHFPDPAPKDLDYDEPVYDADELFGILSKSHRIPFDVHEVIARIVDESNFEEFKADYGKTLVTGFCKIGGNTVGIVANNGVLFSETALKGAHFVEICCQRKIPLLFLQNITGFMVGKKAEAGGIAKDGAKMVQAVATANVPKLTVVIGGSFGAGNYAMCGKAYDPRLIVAWPTAQLAVMSGASAAKTLLQIEVASLKAKGEEITKEKEDELYNRIKDRYDEQISPYYSAARLWTDAIINPLDTRKWISMGIEAANHAPIEKAYNVGVIQT